jgi:predicted TIM-barrel fold metal-dependent hydrolase
MARHNLPVWIHPMRGPNFPDYATEDASENEIWFTFGWPYETSACMTRLIFAGIFDKLPTLKIISHHMGGMIPFFAEKIALGFRQIFDGEMDRNPAAAQAGLKRQPIEYFRMLYADTALNGSVAATRCGHAFFTTDHSLFATDAPFDSEGGRALVGRTVAAIDALEISDAERQQIFAGNAKALLRLA